LLAENYRILEMGRRVDRCVLLPFRLHNEPDIGDGRSPSAAPEVRNGVLAGGA
jgi:hypothetical protein